MARKIARQSEITPSKTIDEYLWNERLGVTQLPPVDTSQDQTNTSSLPPQSSQAPTIDYDSSKGQSDMFGSGVSGAGQRIAPATQSLVPGSHPATGGNAPATPATPATAPSNSNSSSSGGGFLHDVAKAVETVAPLAIRALSSKDAAVSTLYGDVNPTPTIGGSGGNGAQSNRNDSTDSLPNGPDASPASKLAPGEGEAAGGLAAELGEAAPLLALAKKRWIGSVLDPKEASDDKDGNYKYIKHRNGKWVIIQKGTGKVLSTHDSREKAIASFKALEANMHS